jgi:long-chain acyl-CoA synthetase
VADWCGGAKVRNLYGITETGSWIAASPADAAPADGLIGRPWGAEIKLTAGGAPDQAPSRSQCCSVGKEGHVWVKTEALMTGYLDRADLTAEKIIDGWFCTGDIGVFDPEGQLFLKGRERDEINRGGLKIYPADIESVVSSFAAVRESCSFGHDDSRYGQSVAIALVMEEDDPSTLKKLYAWTSERLAEHKIPTQWYLLDDIPKSDRGKINRGELASHCAARPALDMKRILGTAE